MFVRLSGWSTSREIVEHDGRLYFEVAEQGHCSTCQSRINHVRAVVTREELQVTYGHLLDRFPRDASTLWVGLEKTQEEMSNEEIKDIFREKLDLPIL